MLAIALRGLLVAFRDRPESHGRASVASATGPLVRRPSGATGKGSGLVRRRGTVLPRSRPASGLVVNRDRLASGHSHPQVGQPMHSSRLVGKWLGEAEAGAEPHSDLASPPDAAKPRHLVLAIVDQAVAVTTGEDSASGVSPPPLRTPTPANPRQRVRMRRLALKTSLTPLPRRFPVRDFGKRASRKSAWHRRFLGPS
jgi:hypothetical protein